MPETVPARPDSISARWDVSSNPSQASGDVADRLEENICAAVAVAVARIACRPDLKV